MQETPVVPTGRFVIPEDVATHFHLRSGDTVADFGAGRGYFVPILSALVGPEGKVFACEIQKNLTELIGETARTQNLTNVEVRWCDIEAPQGTKLIDEDIDVAMVVNTLFQMEEKEIALQEIKRTLRPGGKFFVIDWSESFGGLGPQPEQVLSEEDTKALVESQGFVYERSYDAGDHHYGLAFRKP